MIDERDKIIEELRAQIESMKCCGNCRYDFQHENECPCVDCEDWSEWELYHV